MTSEIYDIPKPLQPWQ